MGEREDSFAAFAAAVRDSVEGHAKRKGYRDSDVDGPNELADFMHSIKLPAGISLGQAHATAEVIYKCLENLKQPRRVNWEKVAGWASLGWSRTPADK